ncbi:hypothetical protein [Nocardia takedensis]|uniref:hypothetical protein n=1 Tax=Nocardia takedensis TaxID=259390 RepID=UPI00031E6320|nr:hypothetical protein [Nocardia takedensis]
MKVYADRFPVMLRQVVTDLLVVAWVYLSVRVALWFHDLVRELAVPGRKLEDAGAGLAENLTEAGERADRIPVVGDDLTSPFERAAAAARRIAEAGADQQAFVDDLALASTIAVLIIPLALVLFGWLPRRIRWMRRAAAAKRLRAHPAGLDLLALRALANQPLRKLKRVDAEVVDAWRRGDERIVRDLAALELRGLGLRGARAGQIAPE